MTNTTTTGTEHATRAELEAELLRLRRAQGSVEDTQLEKADGVFDTCPEKRRVNALIKQLLALDLPPCDGHDIGFELDDAIMDLVFAAQEWVLDRMVIGLWESGTMQCVSNWRALRRIPVDPIEYAIERERRDAEYRETYRRADADKADA
jgi:hypothetical protein